MIRVETISIEGATISGIVMAHNRDTWIMSWATQLPVTAEQGAGSEGRLCGRETATPYDGALENLPFWLVSAFPSVSFRSLSMVPYGCVRLAELLL